MTYDDHFKEMEMIEESVRNREMRKFADMNVGEIYRISNEIFYREYTSLERFYSQDPRRRYSGEADYGCYWRRHYYPNATRWRVSYVEATGEIYAVELGGENDGRVVVIGVVLPDEVKNKNDWREYILQDARPYSGWMG